MEFVTCCICGNRVQNSNGVDICGICIKTQGHNVKILAIKKYLEIYPKATVQDVIRDLSIKQRDIDKYVEEGSIKLVYSKESLKVVNAEKDAKELKNSSKEEREKNVISQLAKIYNSHNEKDKKQEKSQLLTDLNRKYNKQNGNER